MKKIKGLYLKIQTFLAYWFDKEYAFAKKHSQAAMLITQALKSAVESPVSGIIVNIIPGQLDNQIHAKALKVVPVIAFHTAVVHNILHASDTNADAVGAIISHIKTLNPEARRQWWLDFSAALNQAFSDGKLSFAEACALAQMAYAEHVQKRLAA